MGPVKALLPVLPILSAPSPASGASCVDLSQLTYANLLSALAVFVSSLGERATVDVLRLLHSVRTISYDLFEKPAQRRGSEETLRELDNDLHRDSAMTPGWTNLGIQSRTFTSRNSLLRWNV